MLNTLKHFLTRGYTLFILSIFIFTFSILKVSAVYYPTDNITNPTCAPGDSGCYVSLLPDQTSKAGSLLFSDGTNPSWANPAGMTWDSAENTLLVKRVLRLGNNSVTPNSGVGSALYITGRADYSTPNLTYEPFITAQPYGVQFVVRVQRTNGTPAAPTAVLAGQTQYAMQLGPRGTSGYTTNFNVHLIQGLSDATSGVAPYIRHVFSTTGDSSGTVAYMYPQGLLIANDGIDYTTTPSARLHINTSSTYTNGILVNNQSASQIFSVRDSGKVTVGSNPVYTTDSGTLLNVTGNVGVVRSTSSASVFIARNISGGLPTSSATIGSIGAGVYDGSNWVAGGNRFSFFAAENQTNSAQGTWMRYFSIPIGSTSSNVALEVTPSGQFNFGTTTLYPTLTETSRIMAWGLGNTSSTWTAQFHNSTGANNALMIRDDGRVAIGNNAPSHTLHVGSNSVVGIVSRFQNSTGTCDINPTTTSLSCSSDRTLKTNITNLNNTILNQITSLQPVTYTWINDNTNQQQTGFIAQDVEQIFPSLVSTDPTTNLKSLNYIGLIPYTIEGIKELDVKVNQLSSLDTMLTGSFAFLLKEVLGNVSNGINELYVKVVKSDRVETKQLCTTDGICLSENDIKNLYQISQERNQSNPEVAPQNQPAPENPPVEEIPQELPPQENGEVVQ